MTGLDERTNSRTASNRPATITNRPATRWIRWMVAFTLLALVHACDDSPVSPNSPPPPPTNPSLVLSGARILGPESIPPGEARQLTVIADFADGSSGAVTGEVVWNTDDASGQNVLSISPSGLATAHQRGRVTVQARYQSIGASKTIFVLPDGTFAIGGLVTDDGVPLHGTLVEVTSGSATGLSAVTSDGGIGEGGHYVLYGVAGDTELRASKQGYEPHLQRTMVTGHDYNIGFRLVPLDRPQWSGTYVLRISADPACSSALPQAARTRTYTAVVQQRGPRIDVLLRGASFLLRAGLGDRFSGHVEPDRVVFELQALRGYGYDCFYCYYYYPQFGSVVEQLDPTVFFSPSGRATTRASAAGLSGTLDGTIETFQPADLRVAASCRSDAHEFVLSR